MFTPGHRLGALGTQATVPCVLQFIQGNGDVLFPFVWGYNSNSFTHGLLNSVGIEPERPKESVPGWNRPIPVDYFGK